MEAPELLKKKLKARVETTEIIDVMKKAAVAQFRALENSLAGTDRSSEILKKFVRMIDIRGCLHPFVSEISSSTAVVIITSDEGFLGGLNSSIIKLALDIQEERDAELIVIGERGSGYIEDMGLPFSYFPGFSEDLSYDEIVRIKEYLMHEYISQQIGQIIVVYPQFVSFSHQQPDVLQLLPCNYIFPSNPIPATAPGGIERRIKEKRRKNEAGRRTREKGEDLDPFFSSRREKGQDRREGQDRRGGEVYKEVKYKDLEVEPDMYAVVDYLCKEWIEATMYKIAKSSKLSEFAARSIHLEGSYQEFTRKNKEVKFQYQKSVHEAVDKAIREVFASMLLWKEEP